MSLVSIIVPCFDVADYINDTLKSLTSQRYQNIEIILIDDGNSIELESCISPDIKPDKRIKIIRHAANQGLSNARNTGLINASGDYILFWDADDYLNHDTVEILLAKTQKNPPQVVRGVLARKDQKQRWITKRGRRLLKNIDQTNFVKSPELAMDFTSCGILFEKKFLDEYEICFEPDLYMQDILFMSKVLLLANSISMTDHIVGDYIQSPTSASRLRSEKRFEALFILYEKLEHLFKKQNLKGGQRDVLLAGFINSGVNTFLLWKLEDYENEQSDLERLSLLLNHIGENAINQYCLDMYDEPSYLRLHATRLENYKLAALASSISTISPDHLDELFKDEGVQAITSSTAFLNQLRKSRASSETNSRLVLESTKPSSLNLRNLVSWLRLKLSF